MIGTQRKKLQLYPDDEQGRGIFFLQEVVLELCFEE
jgi:hypothetical protein